MAPDPYRYFRIEARELVAGLSEGALALEKNPGDGATLARMLRLAHTLKGAARVVRRPAIADLAHAAEDVLAPHRDGATPVPAGHVADVLRIVDTIAALIADLDGPPPGPAAPDVPAARAEEAFETVRVDLREMDDLLEAVFEAGVQIAGMAAPLAEVVAARHLAVALADQLRGRPGANPSPAGARGLALAQELVSTLGRAHDGLATTRRQADVEVALVRDRAYQMRLLPASAVFATLERSARDAAHTLGKRIDFSTSGGEVRLDAHVLETLRDALLHVVRNAVAHGVESAAARRAAGKPPAGHIRLSVERREGRVTLTCADDGPGIDLEAIRTVAARRGVVTAAEAAALSLEAAVQLLLAGGLTTTASVDAVSGRGIGLDVVRAAAAGLRGEVTLRSEPGRGTTVAIRVPLTLSSLVALAVEAGGVAVWIPLDAVVRTAHLTRDALTRAGGSESFVSESESLPFLPLATLFAIEAGPARVRRAGSVVVVEGGGRRAVLGVDRLVGLSTIVVRPLPPGIDDSGTISGATLDAEGVPQLVLDPGGVVRVAHAGAAREPSAAPAARLPVLVIDDSLTTRMLEQSILESAGFEVDVAVSAEEGLLRAGQRRYAVFVVDVEMPGMDGFEFVTRTRADPVLRDIPAILVTSRSAPEDKRRGEEAGAVAYIVKSEFDQGVLLGLIHQLVG